MFYFFPGEVESCEVFAEAVGVVGGFALGAGDIEELAAGFAEGVRFLADLDDVVELDAVEGVDLGDLFFIQHRGQSGCGVVFIGRCFPCLAEAGEFGFEDVRTDAAADGEGGHAGDAGVEVAEVAGPGGFIGAGEFQETFADFLAHGHAAAVLGGVAVEFVVEVRFDVFVAVAEAGELVGPQIDAGEEVVAEGAFTDADGEVAVRPGDELEITGDLLVGTERSEAFFFESAEEHGLFIAAEFTDLIKEEEAAIGRAQEAGAIFQRAREGAFHMAEEGAHGGIATEGGAVHFHESAAQFVAELLQFIDAFGELGFTGTGRAHEKNGIAGGDGNMLDLFDKGVEAAVFGFDARFQEGVCFLHFTGETGGEFIVGREIEVDDAIGAIRRFAGVFG